MEPLMTNEDKANVARYQGGDEGQKEYCVVCLKGDDLYALWLINNHLAKLKPMGQCSHK